MSDAESPQEGGRFQRTLTAEIEKGERNKRDLYDLSAALAFTRRMLGSTGLGQEIRRRAERLLMEGQLAVARRIERAYARESLAYEKAHLLANELSLALAEAIDRQGLESALATYLPQFGYAWAAMTALAGPALEDPQRLPPSSTLEFSLGCRSETDAAATEEPSFPTLDILPERAWPSGPAPVAILGLPLVDRGRLLGYLFLESRSKDSSLYAVFRSQVAGAIGRLALLRELLERETRERVETEKMAALGTLVAGIAHEVNTPVGVGVTAASHLEVILTALERAWAEGTLTKEGMRDFLDEAAETSRLLLSNLSRAASLIASFKRVAVDSSSEERRIFDLRGYIQDIVASLSPRLKRASVAVELDCPAGIEVDSYPGALSQALANLILNSIEHGYPEGRCGRVRIQASSDGAKVSILCLDDGQGIPEQALPHIFEPFFTTHKDSGGSGLGLHIAYNAVAGVMGGRISASNHPGGGAAFSIEFPLKARGGAHDRK
jgi:signal transduction histidine kinase